MLNIATAEYDIFAVSSIEKKHKLSGFSLDTIRKIKEKYPATRFYFIIGSDNLSQIHLWHQPDKLFEEIDVISGSRPDSESVKMSDRLLKKIEYIKIQEQDISSTKIRELLRKKDYRALTTLIHPGVIEYIRERKLYL